MGPVMRASAFMWSYMSKALVHPFLLVKLIDCAFMSSALLHDGCACLLRPNQNNEHFEQTNAVCLACHSMQTFGSSDV